MALSWRSYSAGAAWKCQTVSDYPCAHTCTQQGLPAQAYAQKCFTFSRETQVPQLHAWMGVLGMSCLLREYPLSLAMCQAWGLDGAYGAHTEAEDGA